MRISDWSSDVCSSVLAIALIDATQRRTGRHQHRIRVGIERHLERSDRQREAAEHAPGGDDQRAAKALMGDQQDGDGHACKVAESGAYGSGQTVTYRFIPCDLNADKLGRAS